MTDSHMWKMAYVSESECLMDIYLNTTNNNYYYLNNYSLGIKMFIR